MIARNKVHEIAPTDVKQWVDDGQAILIDVREFLEYTEEHIPKAELHPRSTFDPSTIPEPFNKKLIFYCLSGKRALALGAKWLEASGNQEVYCLQGGLEAWKKQGLPTVLNLDVERKIESQAYILSGFVVFLGSVLSFFFSNWFLIIPVVSGILLILAGCAGHRYRSFLLSKLPYNK
jgi:rhodanese-related sulfurtransferase